MDASGVFIKYVLKDTEAEKHYGYEKSTSSRSYDPDFEDPPRDALQIMQDSHGVKYFVRENIDTKTWYCKEAGKQRIMALLQSEGIPYASVREVYKVLNGYWRDYESCNWGKIHTEGWSGPLRFKDMTGELHGDSSTEEESE